MPTVDTFRPRARPAPRSRRHSGALHVGFECRSAATGMTGRQSYRPARRGDPGVPAFQGTLVVGRRRLLAAFTAMDEMGALSYRVWYYASLHYDEDQREQRDQRPPAAGADPVRAAAAGELLVQPRAAGHSRSRRSAAGWTRTTALAVYRFAIESLFHEQEHVLDEKGERLLSYSGRFNSVPYDSYCGADDGGHEVPVDHAEHAASG